MPGLKLEPVDGSPAIEIQGDRATIGRTAGVDHIVNDPSVSRQHAVFECHGGSWTVTDTGSANGTFVDRQKITTAEIRDGQEIHFGKKAFRVRVDWADLPTALMPAIALEPEPIPEPPPASPPVISPPPVERPAPAPSRPAIARPRPIATRPPGTTTVPGLWHDGTQLVFVKDVRLPDRCLKCGAPATYRLDRKLAWHNPWLYVLILPGLLIYAIVAAIVSKRARVGLPLCDAHRKRRIILISVGLAVLFLGTPLVIVVGLMISSLLSPSAGVAIGILATLTFIGGIGLAMFGDRVVTPKRIDDQFVWLDGVDRHLVSAFPPWPGPAAAFVELASAGGITRDAFKPEPTRLSRAAMIFGWLSILLWPAPVAAVLGILSIIDLRIAPGRVGMGRSIFGLVAGLLGSMVLAVVLVGSIASNASRPSAPRASMAPVVRTVTIASKDGTLRITAPWGWRSETALNKIAELQACDPPQQVCLVVIREARTTDTVTLERFSRVARGLALKNLEGGIESAPVSLQVDGHDALQYELRGTTNQINFVYLHTSILTPTHYYQAIGWTSADVFPREKAVLSGITSSFHAVEAP